MGYFAWKQRNEMIRMAKTKERRAERDRKRERDRYAREVETYANRNAKSSAQMVLTDPSGKQTPFALTPDNEIVFTVGIPGESETFQFVIGLKDIK